MLRLFAFLEYILVLIYFVFETDFLHTFSYQTARDSCIANTFEAPSPTCTEFLGKEMGYQGGKNRVEEAQQVFQYFKKEMD